MATTAVPAVPRTVSGRMKPVVYVSNLPFGVASVQLEEVFHSLTGFEVKGVELLKKGHNGFMKTCGLACIIFDMGVDVDLICSKTDGKDCMGRPMIVRKDRFVEDSAAYETPAPVQQVSNAQVVR